ncbi:5-methylcytosine restriction system specificity protein McrC [Rhizohabitans arisaemae]|uniref:5-methylcytosine restriction system specificity protein McrC n=1 Tax=Rhizohabitans arisaemae TaxID=2720610 RepID=UPI0024B14563|nr:hypothetical protein [Rhizohabitans arisaemae]
MEGEPRPGDVVVRGFVFDMPSVFEDFVTVTLRQALVGSGGRCSVRDTMYLDDRNAIRMRPDFGWYSDGGTPLAVADAKYKVGSRMGYPDADLYQMLAYCTALGLTEGHLLYAKGHAPHTAHRIKRAGITLHQHALELDQPPAGLLADIQTLAHHLTSAVP